MRTEPNFIPVTNAPVGEHVGHHVAGLLDRSGVIAPLAEWSPPERRSAPSNRATLAVLLLLAFDKRPLSASEAAHLLRDRLTSQAADALGLTPAVRKVSVSSFRGAMKRLTDSLGADDETTDARIRTLACALTQAQYAALTTESCAADVDVVVDAHFASGRYGEHHVTASQPAVRRGGHVYNIPVLTNANRPAMAIGLGRVGPKNVSRSVQPLLDELLKRGFKLDTVTADRAYLPGPLYSFLDERGVSMVMDDRHGRLKQKYEMGSPDWVRAKIHSRQRLESYIKSLQHNEPTWRGGRNLAAHGLAMTLSVVASNRRRIRAWKLSTSADTAA